MNEHDSERIAGLLEADGLVAAAIGGRRRRRRAQHLLHPRERRQQAVRQPRPPEDRGRPRREGRQIVVSGCLAQKDRERRPRAGRATSTSCSARTTSTAPPSSCARPAPDGPITEILDAAVLDDHAMFPSALPARRETSYNAWVTIQIGCDNSCAFCIVPAVRGVEISRPFADDRRRGRARSPPQGVTEVTLLGQNVNSYGRDLQLAARRAGDTDGRAAAAVRRPARAPSARVDGIRRVRFTSRRTPRTCAPRRSRRWPTTPAVCEHLHYPLQSGIAIACSRRCTAATPPSATSHRLAEARARRRRPRRVDRHHRRLPGRDRRRLRRHARGRRRGPSSTTPTRSSSRRDRAPRRPR